MIKKREIFGALCHAENVVSQASYELTELRKTAEAIGDGQGVEILVTAICSRCGEKLDVHDMSKNVIGGPAFEDNEIRVSVFPCRRCFAGAYREAR